MKNHKHIDCLKVGDTIKTRYKGEVVKKTITSILVDPTWKPNGSVLIEFDGKTKVSLSDLVSWFDQATWEKV